MNTAIKDTALPATGGQITQRNPQPRRRLTLCERMRGQYWRIARRRRVLYFIGQIFQNDLTIYPLQLEETVIHLTTLRRAVQKAHEFYRTLDPYSMQRTQPWGTITKLDDFESQVTEVLLCVVAMQDAIKEGCVLARIQMHVVIRELFPSMLASFEDLSSQLGVLPEKARESRKGDVWQ